MKTLKFLLYVSIIVVTGCGNRPGPDESLYRWRSIQPAADSIVIALEDGFVNSASDSILLPLLDSLRNVPADTKVGNQLRCRELFWNARIANRRNTIGKECVIRDLMEAAALCDTEIYEYDYSRIRYLLALVSESDPLVRFRCLKNLERYYSSSGDDMMLASVRVDIGHLMGEIGYYDRALQYYKEADSIYRFMNIEPYVRKNTLNMANALVATGNKNAALAIVDSLMKDRNLSLSPSFHTNLLRVAYMASGNADYLYEAERYIDSTNRRSLDKLPVEFYLSRYCANADDSAGMRVHTQRMEECFDSVAHGFYYPEMLKLMAITHDMYGNSEAALQLYRKYIVANDSARLAEKAKEIANAETRSSIQRYESEVRHAHKIKILRLWITIMLLLLLVMAVICIYFYRQRQHRLTLVRYDTELAYDRRRVVAQELAMTEKDNVLQEVLDNLDSLKDKGVISGNAILELENSIRLHLCGRQNWDYFKTVFNKVCPTFVNTLMHSYPALTEGDVRLAVYIRAGLTSKQIAQMLLLQPDSVKKNRQRLRRRMNLTSGESLEEALYSISPA